MRDHLRALSATKKWLCLVFASGCVNSGGWLAAAKFTTHVTGFATNPWNIHPLMPMALRTR